MRTSEEGRHSIWSVSLDDQRLFSILFPSIWLVGMAFHIVWSVPWVNGILRAMVPLTESVATTGVASAVLTMMVLAGKGGIMVLFDWSARMRKKWAEEDYEKGRQEGREEGHEQERQEWEAWAQRLLQSLERQGIDFDEPPPSAKNGTEESPPSK